MSEQLLCESVAEKRAQEILKLNDRTARLEGKIDVIVTRLEFAVRDALTDDDLDKREEKIMAAVKEQIGHVCDHFDKENRSLEHRLIAAVDESNRRYAARVARRNDKARDRIIRYGFWFAGLLVTLITILTSGAGAELGRTVGRALSSLP